MATAANFAELRQSPMTQTKDLDLEMGIIKATSIILAIALCHFTGATSQAQTAKVKIGSPMPDFKLKDFRGKEFSSTEFKNKSTIAVCLLYTSPSPRDRTRSRMPSSA